VEQQAIVREYRPDDEAATVSLLSLVFKEERSVDWWRWYYQSGHSGPAILKVAVWGDRIVGFRGLVPYRVWDGRRYVTACQATDAATHPEFRGRGIFRTLTQEAIREAERRGYSFIFNFPNEMSYPIYRSMGWTVLARPRMWLRVCQPGRQEREPGMATLDMFDSRFTDHWKVYGESRGASICKDAGYLNWRYASCPDRRYIILVEETKEEVLAYVVLRFGGAARKRAYIVEFSPGALDPAGLLRRVIRHAAHLGARVIAAWPLPGLAHRMWQFGLVPNLLRTGRFALRQLTGETPVSWQPVLGDTDYL